MSQYHLDVGLLTVTNESTISGPMRSEEEMRDTCEKSLKVLLGECVGLPTTFKKGKFDETGYLVQLPAPVMQLPREKAPPKPKPLTAWEKFAMKKGIDTHKKKERRVFDEDRQEWKDRWGKRAREEKEKYDWLREVKPGYVAQEPGGDPFLDEKRAKQQTKEKMAKKEAHNKRRSEYLSRAEAEVKRLQQVASQINTASNGKFDVKKTFKKGKSLTKSKKP